MKKRGQITLILLVVVGLLILAFVLISLRKGNKPGVDPKEISEKAIPVKFFVEDCLYTSAANGLKLLGEQGGVIFKSQGGLTGDSYRNDNFSIQHGSQRVEFSILPGTISFGRSCSPGDIGKSYYNYQFCPSVSFPYIGIKNPALSFLETESDIPPINNRRLFNRLMLPGLDPREDIYVDPDMNPSGTMTSALNKIPDSLSEFIEKNISGCLNYSILNERDLNVTENGEKAVEIIFSDDFTQAKLDFPLTITYLPTSQKIQMKEFTAKVDVRFRKVYKYITDILYNESKDFTFNLSLFEKKEFDGISMKLKKDFDRGVDIVNFTDANSTLPGGNKYSFIGAIPNSAPAISYFFSNISNDFIPQLKGALLRCPQFVHDNPFEEDEDRLMIVLGGRLNKNTTQCLFWAYNQTFSWQKWKPVYDADDDEITLRFKTKKSKWDQELIYSGEYIIFKNNITLNASDGMYEDIAEIPIELKNHKPNIKDFVDTEGIGDAITYNLIVEDEDARLGPAVDYLTINVTGDNAILDYYPPDSTALGGAIGKEFHWPFSLKNIPGTYTLKFKVDDQHSLYDIKTFTVDIP